MWKIIAFFFIGLFSYLSAHDVTSKESWAFTKYKIHNYEIQFPFYWNAIPSEDLSKYVVFTNQSARDPHFVQGWVSGNEDLKAICVIDRQKMPPKIELNDYVKMFIEAHKKKPQGGIKSYKIFDQGKVKLHHLRSKWLATKIKTSITIEVHLQYFVLAHGYLYSIEFMMPEGYFLKLKSSLMKIAKSFDLSVTS